MGRDEMPHLRCCRLHSNYVSTLLLTQNPFLKRDSLCMAMKWKFGKTKEKKILRDLSSPGSQA